MRTHQLNLAKPATNTHATESARALHALAYTVGQNIVFGPGQYATGTSSGRGLLAHELTHTLEQSQIGSSSLSDPIRVSNTGNADEREAEAVAARVSSVTGGEAIGANIRAPAYMRPEGY